MLLRGCRVVAWMLLITSACPAEDWPQWRGPRRDGTWRDSNIVDRFAGPEAELAWQVPLGAGYCGPTVADGRVFVMDRVTEPNELEGVHCFRLDDGEQLWSHRYACPYEGISYQAGPRASVSVDGNRSYALGATGLLHCLDVSDGSIAWKRDLDADYDISGTGGQDSRMPIWGISASPLVVKDVVVLHIGGRSGACVVGLDKRTGAEKWRALDDRAQYSAPILVEQAGRQVVVVWTGDSVAGLAPESGQVYWRFEFTPVKMPIGVATPVVKDDLLFLTSFYDGSLMLRLGQSELSVTEVWRARGRSETDTEALHSIISTPIWLGDYIYGVDSYGELRCLEAVTGRRIWEDQSATPRARWSTIHFVQHEDDVWMFNERGELLIGRLTRDGLEERSRTKLIRPTLEQLRRRNGVCWAHPAFASGRVLARNDQQLVCFDVRASN
jgi:outer membrane protein assembly factor BamB